MDSPADISMSRCHLVPILQVMSKPVKLGATWPLDPMMRPNTGEQLPSLCSQGCSEQFFQELSDGSLQSQPVS